MAVSGVPLNVISIKHRNECLVISCIINFVPQCWAQRPLLLYTPLDVQTLVFLRNYLKGLMPITFSSPRAQPEV